MAASPACARGFGVVPALIMAAILALTGAVSPAAAADIPDEQARIDGVPYVGAELRLRFYDEFLPCKNPDGTTPDGMELEWLRDDVPLPAERQGETLKLLPEDRDSTISLKVTPSTPQEPGCPDEIEMTDSTAPIKASPRGMGWTGRGNFEVIGRTYDGRLVLYPRTYTYQKTMCGEVPCPMYNGSWDQPVQVGVGWNIFDIVFSPGDFDGDGNNDLLARNSSGQLFLYPGDGTGGWLRKRQVGSGWNIFDSIVGPGDFNGDGSNDVLARNASGDLLLYPGDGSGGWLPPSRVGWGWQVMDKIIPAGDMNSDGAVDILARDFAGNLYQYPSNGSGGWQAPVSKRGGWNVFPEMVVLGSLYHNNANDLVVVDQSGGLFESTVAFGGMYPIGTGWNIFRALL